MKDFIKQVLRESNDMLNIHDKEKTEYKPFKSVNKLYFDKLKSQGMGLYILTRDGRHILFFNKVDNDSQLKKYENNKYRVDAFVVNENTAEKIKKAVGNMNEIVELKYKSIKLLNEHLIASISEAIKKQK